MKQYDSYKYSGVEWIGEIPECWNLTFLKHIASIRGRIGFRGYSAEDLVPEGEGALVLGGTNLTTTGILNLSKRTYLSWQKYEESPEIVVSKDDLVMGQRGTCGNVVIIDREIGPTTINPSLVLLKKPIINSKFLCYLLMSNYVQNIFDSYLSSTAVPMLTQQQIGNVPVIIPSPSEQIAISSFLERKTAEIDQLITNKGKLISLYEEEKTTIINRAVTRGLDPQVKLKPSGVDWLGDIPEHWEVKRLKYVASMKSGEGITSDQIKEFGDYPVYGGNGLRGYFDSFTHEGDYALIGRQGALCGNINYASGKFWASEHAIVCTLADIYEVKWLGELLKTMNLNQYSVSAAQPGLSVENIKVLQIPVPPPSEQTAIVTHIEIECARLDAIIDKFKKQIELFKEYRTTLISEVVTGKIDIRDEVAA